jgi:hypothetical protein
VRNLRSLIAIGIGLTVMAGCTATTHRVANSSTSPGNTAAADSHPSSSPIAYPATGSLLTTSFGPAAPAAQRIFGKGVNFPRVGHGAPGELVVVTTGSGSCPSVPTTVRVANPDEVTVDIGLRNSAGACTDDLRVTNNLIATPGLDRTKPVRVVLRFVDGARTTTEAGTLPAA